MPENSSNRKALRLPVTFRTNYFVKKTDIICTAFRCPWELHQFCSSVLLFEYKITVQAQQWLHRFHPHQRYQGGRILYSYGGGDAPEHFF